MAWASNVPRSPLQSAGQGVVADVAPQEPMRFLATAYDHNWNLKRIVPKDAIPRPGGLPRSPSNYLHQQLKKSPKKDNNTHMGFTRPAALDVSHTLEQPGSEPVSPKSPMSPGARAAHRKRKEAREFLAKIKLEDRPASAESKEETKRKASKERRQKLQEEDDKRQEMPLDQWAGSMGVPFDIAIQALDTFLDFVKFPPEPKFRIKKADILSGKPFDAGTDLGSMDTESFGKSCLMIADCKDFSTLPEGFLDQAMRAADKNNSNDIDFGEFLYFYYKFSFSEEVLLGPGERQIRCAAREHAIPYDEIGRYKNTFDQIDVNKNGRICSDEFKVLVAKLLKIPRGEELPETRSESMWREASRKGKDLDFIAFVGWYKRYFINDNEDRDESPLESYYHNIRRVSCYDSSLHH